jgi:hypothetical protein
VHSQKPAIPNKDASFEPKVNDSLEIPTSSLPVPK